MRERDYIQAEAGVSHWPQKGGLKVEKTINMEHIASLRYGFDLYTDGEFYYVGSGENILIGFPRAADLDFVKGAFGAAMAMEEEIRKGV